MAQDQKEKGFDEKHYFTFLSPLQVTVPCDWAVPCCVSIMPGVHELNINNYISFGTFYFRSIVNIKDLECLLKSYNCSQLYN